MTGFLWLAVVAYGAEADLSKIKNLPENPTEGQVKAYLSAIKEQLSKAYESRSDLGYVTFSSAQAPGEDVVRAAHQKLAAIPTSFLEVMCKTADTTTSPILSQLIADSLEVRRDYRPEDRVVVLTYLAKLPKLIHVAERMDWFDVNAPLGISAWKKIKQQAENGVLGLAAYRFAILAAGKGLKDALITLADSANMRLALRPSPQRDAMIKTDAAILRALVPSQLEGRALADFILKNKAALVFDQEKRTYALKPVR
jgi:hypothetical protein